MSELTLLVVEDDDGMRHAIERLLDAAGFRVASFSSAEELLSESTASSAACLIFDVHLPGLSGFELRRVLARTGSTPPVIFITADDTPAAREEAGRLRAAAYLPKPFQGRELVAAVSRAVAPA
jgi:FixJ family two-component response regulator